MASKDNLNKQDSSSSSTSSSCVHVMYKECWRNHAVLIGGYAADGCGEFIPKSNQEGTKEALLCEACGCHRNFHRKEVIMKNGQTILGSHHLGPFNWRSSQINNFDSISSSCFSSFNEVSDEESVVCSGNYHKHGGGGKNNQESLKRKT